MGRSKDNNASSPSIQSIQNAQRESKREAEFVRPDLAIAAFSPSGGHSPSNPPFLVANASHDIGRPLDRAHFTRWKPMEAAAHPQQAKTRGKRTNRWMWHTGQSEEAEGMDGEGGGKAERE
jgi:hypothetical protein